MSPEIRNQPSLTRMHSIQRMHSTRRMHSIRGKIIGWSLLPTAIILIIVAWATFYAYQRVTEELVIERDRELTHLIAGEIGREVTKYAELLSILARKQEIYDRSSITYKVVIDQIGSIAQPRIGEGGCAYLVNNAGQIIYHSESSQVGQNISAQPVVQRVLDGKVGALRTHDAQGREIVASFAPVPDTNWGLITEESWQVLTRSSQGYQRALVFLMALGVLAPAIAITIGVRRITRPITELTNAAQEIAQGKFNQTINVSTGDELEELAGQFNSMATQLRASYQNLERKVADRTRELAALNTIAASVNESLDLDQTLNRALDEMLHLLKMEVGEIRLLESERDILTIQTQRGLSSNFIQHSDRRPAAETPQGQALLACQPVLCEDIAHHLDQEWAQEENLQAFAICPLRVKDKQLGTLSLATRRGPRVFSQNERELLHAVSDQIGVAVENARLFEVEQRRADQFQVISQVGQKIASILAVDELLDEIVRLVKETLGYYLVGIGLIENDEIIIKTGTGQTVEIQNLAPIRFEVDETSILSWVARHGEPLRAPDVTQEPRYRPLPHAHETRSELAVPLKAKDVVIGVLDVQSKRLNAFDEKDMTVLQSLAHQAAIALENARLYQRAQQLAVMEERNRLARDLHDSVTQSLYGVTLFAEAAGRLLSAGNVDLATEHLQDLQKTAQDALREMRLLIFELRPPLLGENGLAMALQARLEAVEERAGLETTFRMEGQEQRLPPEIEEGLYRVAQEALNNALKHAQAQQIQVYLCQQLTRVTLEVSDDGIGFDVAAPPRRGGMGLRSMTERAAQLGAKLNICSQPGKGTCVSVEVHQ